MGNTYSTHIDSDGNKFWFQNGKFHRDGDLPAIEWASGDKEWYKNGELHHNDNLHYLDRL